MSFSDLFNAKTGKFTNPKTKEDMTLKEALDAGFIDPSKTTFQDARTGEMVPLDDAMDRGIVDAKTGLH